MDLLYILVPLGVAGLFLYLKSPTVVGAAGERRVNSTLRKKLKSSDYILLEDITLPTPTGTTQVDHVVISRFGIFVIETKNMSGWIFGDEKQPRWTQVMGRHKSQFQNPLRQNYLHVKTIEAILGIERGAIENLVVFVGSAKPKTEMPSTVFWSRRRLVNFVLSQQIERFTENDFHRYATTLREAALGSDKETRRGHIDHLHNKAKQLKAGVAQCPKCGSAMEKRTNRKTGKAVFGCTQYPECRGSRRSG